MRDAGFDMMSGGSLMIQRRGDLIARLRFHVGKVDVIYAGGRPILGRVAVMCLGGRFFAPRLDGTHLDRRLGQMTEKLALAGQHFVEQRLGFGDLGGAPLVAVGTIETRISPHEGTNGLKTATKPSPPQ